jgi:hypothetical protein
MIVLLQTAATVLVTHTVTTEIVFSSSMTPPPSRQPGPPMAQPLVLPVTPLPPPPPARCAGAACHSPSRTRQPAVAGSRARYGARALGSTGSRPPVPTSHHSTTKGHHPAPSQSAIASWRTPLNASLEEAVATTPTHHPGKLPCLPNSLPPSQSVKPR